MPCLVHGSTGPHTLVAGLQISWLSGTQNDVIHKAATISSRGLMYVHIYLLICTLCTDILHHPIKRLTCLMTTSSHLVVLLARITLPIFYHHLGRQPTPTVSYLFAALFYLTTTSALNIYSMIQNIHCREWRTYTRCPQRPKIDVVYNKSAYNRHRWMSIPDR